VLEDYLGFLPGEWLLLFLPVPAAVELPCPVNRSGHCQSGSNLSRIRNGVNTVPMELMISSVTMNRDMDDGKRLTDAVIHRPQFFRTRNMFLYQMSDCSSPRS
jgi:hypothetical protein